MRIESVLSAYETVRALADIPVTNAYTALKLADALRILSPVVQEVEETRQNLLRKYAWIDSTGEFFVGEDGDVTFFCPENRVEFEKAWEKELNVDVNLPTLFAIENLEGLNVTGMMIYHLLDWLE